MAHTMVPYNTGINTWWVRFISNNNTLRYFAQQLQKVVSRVDLSFKHIVLLALAFLLSAIMLSVVLAFVLTVFVSCQNNNFHFNNHPSISNKTIAGTKKGCKHRTQYFTNPNVQFPMCTGQTDQDLKNGMSIINLINSRGYLPTCRVMQMMLWMASEVSERRTIQKDFFVDIGSNIGALPFLQCVCTSFT